MDAPIAFVRDGLTLTAIAIISTVVASAVAQVKRTPLQTIDFPPGFTTITAIFEIAPGTCAGRHTHPGIETSYLLEGEAILKVKAPSPPSEEKNPQGSLPPRLGLEQCKNASELRDFLSTARR